MAETFVPGDPTKPDSATPVALYTAPGGVSYALVLSLVCANNHAADPDFVTIRKIPSGGAAGDADRELIPAIEVKPRESFLFAEKVLLGPGDLIAVESQNGTVVFTLSMLESTP